MHILKEVKMMDDVQIEINGHNSIILSKDDNAFIHIYDNQLRGNIHDLYLIDVRRSKLKYKINTTIKTLKFIWSK